MLSSAAMPPGTSWIKHFHAAPSFAVNACERGP
jgi:hypothetical protein